MKPTEPTSVIEPQLANQSEEAVCEACKEVFSFTPIVIAGGRTRLVARICPKCDYSYLPEKQDILPWKLWR
jgi:hypothetical protein